MPEDCRLIRVFVSSPSDVSEERSEVDKVVARINDLLGDEQGFHIKTWKWEKDARPRVGTDDSPQGVKDGVRSAGTSTAERNSARRIGDNSIAYRRNEDDRTRHTKPE